MLIRKVIVILSNTFVTLFENVQPSVFIFKMFSVPVVKKALRKLPVQNSKTSLFIAFST